MPSRQPAAPRIQWLTLALVLVVPHAARATGSSAPVQAKAAPAAPATPACALGSLYCPPRPVSYAACHPNDLLKFYQPGLPTDDKGRATSTTDVLAQRVHAAGHSAYLLDGDVRLRRYDQLLRADRVHYNDKTTAYDASGHVKYQDSGLLLSASHIAGTTQPEQSRARQVHYQLLQSRGNGTASSAHMLDAKHSRLRDATYSTCDPDDRVWEFRASRINLNKQTGVGTALNATLRYHDVPFFYFPWVNFPIDHRRKTGLLYPTFGNTSLGGFSYSQPYYLNLAPNYDATLTPRVLTKRGMMLETQFRYLTGLGSGILQADYLPHDRNAGSNGTSTPRTGIVNGDKRYYIHYTNHSTISPSWGFDVNYQRASDVYYFKDFGSDMRYTTINVIGSSAYLNGHGQWWTAALGVDRYQSMDPNLSASSVQYRRWPRGVLNLEVPLTRDLEIGMDSEAVAFRRVRSIEGNRVDVEPYVTWDLGGAGWFFKPRAAYRYTGYELLGNYNRYVNGTPFPQRDPSRQLPIYSIDSGLIFERKVDWFGSSYTQTLEPRLYYLYVPYRNQADLPVFDTRLLTFNYWQMFATNQYSGADRQMNANNLTAAVTTRLLDDNGDERASFSIGQIRYFTPQRVQLARNAPPVYDTGSSYVSMLSLSLNKNWRLDSAYQWSPSSRHNQVATLGIQRRLGVDGIFNFSYRYRYKFLEQLNASAVYPVSPNWRLLGSWNVALRDIYDPSTNPNWERQSPKTIEAVAGVEYDSCCTAVRLVGRHYVRDTQGHTGNTIMLEIEFKGLGSTTPQMGTFLRHDILGYQ